jgi:nuclear protein localization family protein 4
VDYVQLQAPEIMDRFIQGWRDTGMQRCGYLYGKYVMDPDIPLGIRADVAAIYEPPQK